MSFENGRRYVCDRCGKQAFVKTIGDGEGDGGFTRWNKFEPLPRGWRTYKSHDLCPGCSSEWSKIETSFMNQESRFFEKVPDSP